MKKRIIKIVLLIFIFLQIITMLILMIDEIQLVHNGLEYRFQYLLILYFIIPGLIISGLFEFIWFKILTNRFSRFILSPFIIGISLLIAMSFEGNLNSVTLSYYVIFIEISAIIMFLYSFLKILKISHRN